MNVTTPTPSSPEWQPWTADTSVAVRRRPGSSPSALSVSATGANCPDILEAENGDFLVIGTDATDAYRDRLPHDASRADYERIVMIPAATLLSAAGALLDKEPQGSRSA